MATKKIYAVKSGRKTGLFATWDECKAQVTNFKGAVYKGFMTKDEAEAWLDGEKNSDAPTQLNLNVQTEFVVFSDGSCLKNQDSGDSPGGYASFILKMPEENLLQTISGGESATTNNRMELSGVLNALKILPEKSSVAVFTDSRYIQQAFEKNWLANWKKRNWITTSGTPVKNQDLWHALDEEIQKRDVKFFWLKGHAGNDWNERCDKLAKKEAQLHAND